ncbi:MAG: glyoxalase [Ignavibacteriales bacterium CG12_big_fil_rev_8_21_14_0_65_30_8]|nr:MAG: glyoxalase [Ignavibacteriales bacterium CG12_big_fil_rev_8_21_14_0_65_30_8]
MEIRRITPDINSNKIEESKLFYQDYLGLRLAMDMGWILTFISTSNPTAQINILKSGKAEISNKDVFISLEVSDIEFLYKKAAELNYEIVYPITDEPWKVRRFFVKDPNEVTVNIMCHI